MVDKTMGVHARENIIRRQRGDRNGLKVGKGPLAFNDHAKAAFPAQHLGNER